MVVAQGSGGASAAPGTPDEAGAGRCRGPPRGAITSSVGTAVAMCVHTEEAAVLKWGGSRLLVCAVALACVALVGPSAPGGALSGRSLPVEAVKDVVPDRVMTWNLCNPCDASNLDRAAEIAAHAPQVIGMQEACARDVDRIRDYLEAFHGLVYHVAHGSVLQNWSRCGERPGIPGASARPSSRRRRSRTRSTSSTPTAAPRTADTSRSPPRWAAGPSGCSTRTSPSAVRRSSGRTRSAYSPRRSPGTNAP